MRFAAGAAALLALVAAAPGAALADPPPGKTACATTYEHAQEQKKTGKLIEARENLLVCSQPSCPDFIKSDCGQWLTEVGMRTPTLAFSAEDAKGADLTDVRILVDGHQIADSIGGMALPVDPGRHVLRFEHAGATAVEKTVLVREGEKARVVHIQFAAPPAPAATPAPAPAPEAAKGPDRKWVYVLGGAGVVALGVGGAFWIAGRNAENDAKSECAPNCPQDRADSIRAKYRVGDIGVGIGLVSLGVATYLLLHKPAAERATNAVHVDVAVGRRATLASIGGHF